MAKPTNHPRDHGRDSTIALILSVTLPNVWPGAITGGGPVGRSGTTAA
jgi:hypothetical protein